MNFVTRLCSSVMELFAWILEPQVLTGLPSVIRRRGPEGAAEEWWEKTEREAPVSTRKS